MQAGAGLVADSVPLSEFEETTNKAAALGRAIDLAEQAFLEGELWEGHRLIEGIFDEKGGTKGQDGK